MPSLTGVSARGSRHIYLFFYNYWSICLYKDTYCSHMGVVDNNYTSMGTVMEKAEIAIGNINKIKPNGTTRLYAGRPSLYGNPFPLKQGLGRDAVCDLYRSLLNVLSCAGILNVEAVRQDLIGTTLVCYCHPQRCHTEEWVNFSEDLGTLESDLTLIKPYISDILSYSGYKDLDFTSLKECYK